LKVQQKENAQGVCPLFRRGPMFAGEAGDGGRHFFLRGTPANRPQAEPFASRTLRVNTPLRRRVIAVTLMSALPFLSLAACASDAVGPPSGIVAGRYQLQTVNGTTLPFVVVQSDTSKGELTSDQLTLNADGTFSDLEGLRTTRGASITMKQAASIGVYESTDGEIQFTQIAPTLGGFSGSVHHATLIITYPSGNTFVYSR
jgi:hypothetical protein